MGKLKKGPVNRTDTSFTSKKVIIRAQNLKSSSSPDSSGLLAKIKALLPNCGHYNANMRKDASLNVLKVLKELAVAETTALESSEFLALLDPIFVATFRQVCDDENSVRSAFLGLIGFIFENVKRDVLAGFFARWMTFLNLASSHIKPEIRRDSVRFIMVTLRTQRDLFIPYLHSVIPSMIPLLTQYPLRQGLSAAFDCTQCLIDAYLEPFETKKQIAELARPLVSHTWTSNDSPIYIIRHPPSTPSGTSSSGLKPAKIPEASLKSFISHLMNLSISVWLDTVHLLPQVLKKGPSIGSSATELRQLKDLISLYRKLWSLAHGNNKNADCELFWECVPIKLVKNYKSELESIIQHDK